MHTIVFLWPGAVPYMMRIYEQLADWGHRVVVFNSEMDPTTPCFAVPYPGIDYRTSEGLDYLPLLEQVRSINPDVIVTSGWYISKYKKVCKWFSQHTNVPTLCKIDSQYLDTWKQRIGFLISPWFCKPCFSHMLVPGVRQYHFACKLGYDTQHIVMYGLSADVDLFNKVNISNKKQDYPKTFLFVARLAKEKGLEILVKAWKEIQEKNGWNVVIIGTGSEKERLELDKIDGISLFEYMQQNELVKYTENSGVYILPSTYEPWALTIQEFAAAGMPLLCSETCGATPHFLINGYNGYVFETGNFKSLKRRMEQFISMSDEELFIMAENSKKLANQIKPEFTAASILSVIR